MHVERVPGSLVGLGGGERAFRTHCPGLSDLERQGPLPCLYCPLDRC